MGLHIGKFGTKKLLDPINGDTFNFIDMLTSAIVAAARIAFGIFVGQNRSLGGKNVFGDDILRLMASAMTVSAMVERTF